MNVALRFYYTGGSALSESARQELKTFCGRYPDVVFEIEEIDVVLQPTMAEEDGIHATPTIIKFSPPPTVRIVCDLAGLEKALDLGNASGLC